MVSFNLDLQGGWASCHICQGGLEMGLAGLAGLGALVLPHVPELEEGRGRTPTNSNMKALLKNADLVRAPSFHLRNRSK